MVQCAVLPVDLLSTTAQWSLWVTGWCLSPLLLGLPLRVAISIIALNWAGAFTVTFARDPSADTLVALGFLAASLGVLLVAAQVADAMFADAAAETHAQTKADVESLTRQRAIALAHREFRRRIDDVRRSVTPILVKLSRGEPARRPDHHDRGARSLTREVRSGQTTTRTTGRMLAPAGLIGRC